MSIEDILGSPEEYRASQAQAEKEQAEFRDNLRRKMVERREQRKEEIRAEFEAQKHFDGVDLPMWDSKNYVSQEIQAEWEGYYARALELPSFEFMGAQIVLPTDPEKRWATIDELSHVFRSYVTQMFSSWGEGSPVRHSVRKRIQKMCVSAFACLPYNEYEQFANILVERNFCFKEPYEK